MASPNFDFGSSDDTCLASDEKKNSVESEKEGVDHNGRGSCSNVLPQKNEHTPILGQIVRNEDEAYDLYRKYAHCVGFSVRKDKQYYYHRTNKIKRKDFCCSKKGFKNNHRSCKETLDKRDYRTGCKAMIGFTCVEEGVWKVTHLNVEHNHDLVEPDESHLLRSARSISSSKRGILNSMVNAGIRTIDAYSYMVEESAGIENLGFTKKDCYNYVNAQKMMLIEVGDSRSLVNHFKSKVNEECGMFYWDVQLDQDGRMTNFYWRDFRSKIDYECFGDVVVFDTTYRTNRYNLICAPFVGVNHHWQNVMFGCAFLLDETVASFEWLFNTFLKSMGNRSPKTIFTDHDPAMITAIEKVLPNASHRICLWDISKNAPSHLVGLNNDVGFNKLFNKCLQGCESEEEFEATWTTMIDTYDVENNKWLKNLYEIRKKWCTALNKSTFDGGIKSSQRSESANNVLDGIANKSTSLNAFVVGFENLVQIWRKNEADEDYRCRQIKPPLAIKHSNILKHAGNVYTHKLYKLIEEEYLDGIGACDIRQTSINGSLCMFELTMNGRNSNIYIVCLDMETMKVTCTCQKIVTMGILCCHALGVLKLKNASTIPEQYIVKRWTQEAKKRVNTYSECNSKSSDPNTAEIVFRNSMMRCAYDLVQMSQGIEEAKKLVSKVFEECHEKIEQIVRKITVDSHSSGTDNVKESLCEDTETLEFDPICVRPKGVSISRLKRNFEKRKKKSSQGETSTKRRKQLSTCKEGEKSDAEVGSIIPHASLVAQTMFPSSAIGNPVQPNNAFQVYSNDDHIPYLRSSTINLNSNGSDLPFTTLSQGVDVTHLPQEYANYMWRPPPPM